MSTAEHTLAILAFTLLSSGASCATVGPGNKTGASNTDDEAQRKACPDTRGNGTNSDSLGRLVTGPGLCRIASVPKSVPTIDTAINLELSYDDSGLPLEAVSYFEPICAEWGLIGPYDHLDCWVYERQTQRWTWDDDGRLVGAERKVYVEVTAADGTVGGPLASLEDVVQEAEPRFIEDVGCFINEDVIVETITWRYDGAGRVMSSSSGGRDCDFAWVSEEQLSYGPEVVEAKIVDSDDEGSSTATLRYHLDDCGRVISIDGDASLLAGNHYGYDSRGRVISEVDERRDDSWSYEAGFASASGKRTWRVETSRDRRTIWLVDERPGAKRYEIRFDERQRVIAVETEHEVWTLSYDDCPNAEFARSSWRLGEILDTWPFPTPPQAGAGNTDLDAWTHSTLPLTSAQ